MNRGVATYLTIAFGLAWAAQIAVAMMARSGESILTSPSGSMLITAMALMWPPALGAYVARAGAEGFGRAVVAGQRTHPNGLFFGGTSPCWSNRTIAKIVPHYLEAASHVCVLDFHTGLGPPGYSEIICRHAPGSPALALARHWFGDAVTSPAAGESQSPVIEGNLRMAFVRLLPEALVVAAAIEVGTVPPDEVNMALIALRYRMPAHRRPFRVPVAVGKLPVLPVLALASIVLLLGHFEWRIYIAGAIALALSALVYAARQWSRRNANSRTVSTRSARPPPSP